VETSAPAAAPRERVLEKDQERQCDRDPTRLAVRKPCKECEDEQDQRSGLCEDESERAMRVERLLGVELRPFLIPKIPSPARKI
jgi:hypothetical protein